MVVLLSADILYYVLPSAHWGWTIVGDTRKCDFSKFVVINCLQNEQEIINSLLPSRARRRRHSVGGGGAPVNFDSYFSQLSGLKLAKYSKLLPVQRLIILLDFGYTF